MGHRQIGADFLRAFSLFVGENQTHLDILFMHIYSCASCMQNLHFSAPRSDLPHRFPVGEQMPARTRIPEILFCVLACKRFLLQAQQWVVPTHILNQSWDWLVALSSCDLAAGISCQYSTLFHAGW